MLKSNTQINEEQIGDEYHVEIDILLIHYIIIMLVLGMNLRHFMVVNLHSNLTALEGM